VDIEGRGAVPVPQLSVDEQIDRGPSPLERARRKLEPAVTVGGSRLPAVEPEGVAAFLLPFALVVYLALSNGGYGVEARSIVGVLSWVAVVVACLVSARPGGRIGRGGLLALGLLAALAAWTGLSFLWTENQERTAVEVGRMLSYLGVFALALGLAGRGQLRAMAAGLTVGLTVVCALALMSRLQPNWFPERRSADFIPVPDIERRLAYPLNYSGGVATLVTMTVPLLLASAWTARTVLARTLAAAALPMVLVALWLTGSGLILAVGWIGAAVFVSLSEDRLPKLATLAVGLLGGALLSVAVVEFEALDRGLSTPQALAEGDRLLVLTLATMAVVAFAHLWIYRMSRRLGRPDLDRIAPPRIRRMTFGGLAVGTILVIVALALVGAFDSQLDRFRSLSEVSADAPRVAQVTDISSSGRYQQWRAALDAVAAEPVLGLGAGTYEFWWAREGSYGGFVRDAHSLYLETLGELGVVGFLLVAGFVGVIIVVGVRLSRGADGDHRAVRAGVVGSVAAFAAAAAVDWMWELGALTMAFMLLAAIALTKAPDGSAIPRPRQTVPLNPLARAGLIVVGLAAVALIVPPVLAERHLDASRVAFDQGDLEQSYDRAVSAERVQPYAASPRLQQALVLERTGQLAEASHAARLAIERAPTDWRPRVILARLTEMTGNTAEARRNSEEARELNPNSGIFE
jgi:hypothetical protein